MAPITNIFDQLRRDEGEVLHAYQDSLGYWTIGVGHLIDPRKGGNIPKSVSDQLLSIDVDSKIADLYKNFPWMANLDEVRKFAVVNMCFNLGVGGVAAFKDMLAKVQSGDYAGAGAAMLDSKWASQVGDRAQRLALQMEKGEWV